MYKINSEHIESFVLKKDPLQIRYGNVLFVSEVKEILGSATVSGIENTNAWNSASEEKVCS
jgi:hypothetical protein